MKRFLGLDVGTTRMKCGVFDEKGKLLYEDSVDYGEYRSQSESYIDIERIKENALLLLKNAYKNCPFDTVAVSSLGESFVLLDKDDNVVFLPMLYTDNRGEEQASRYSNNAEKIFMISGVYPQSMYSAYKLLWIKENQPDEYKKATKLFLINEYVSYLLTGKRVIDYSEAARTGVFDVRKKQFSKELCDLFDIDINLFSVPKQSGTFVGNVKKDVLKDWGAEKDVTVLAGGHDQVCATIGAGVLDGGACSDGMGTVECMVAIFDNPSSIPKTGIQGYPNVPFLNGYCTYLLNYSCGSLTRWWLESVYGKNAVLDGTAFFSAEQDFTDSPTGLLVLPYFSGCATPYQNINAKGAILNLSLSDSPSKIYQGILEGLSYEMRLNLDMVKCMGVKPKKIVVTGGGSASKKWLKLKASILNAKIYPLKVKEAGVLGCAMMGASYSLNIPLKEIAKTFVKYERAIKPDKELKKQYDVWYKKYKKLYKTTVNFN